MSKKIQKIRKLRLRNELLKIDGIDIHKIDDEKLPIQ